VADVKICEVEGKDSIFSGNYKCITFISGTFLSPLGEISLILLLLLEDEEMQNLRGFLYYLKYQPPNRPLIIYYLKTYVGRKVANRVTKVCETEGRVSDLCLYVLL
jgi:hypothetical protein